MTSLNRSYRSLRVLRAYRGSAFLQFFSILSFPGINNLRTINPAKEFESHRRLQSSRFKII